MVGLLFRRRAGLREVGSSITGWTTNFDTPLFLLEFDSSKEVRLLVLKKRSFCSGGPNMAEYGCFPNIEVGPKEGVAFLIGPFLHNIQERNIDMGLALCIAPGRGQRN